MVVTASRDIAFASGLEGADLVTPDGAPVVWAIRRAGYTQERVNGPDLMWEYLAKAELAKQVVFFFGGKESVLKDLGIAIAKSFPKLKVGGMVSPPFRDLTEEEDESYVAQINAAGAAVVFVGLGCPKQEFWMWSHRDRINSVLIGVGAAFDYHAGSVRRAPVWMQHIGLEWAYRLLTEPRRLWKRYLVTNVLFLIGMAKCGFKAK